eukprot:scaffold13899_cov153-Amphora_coffeaeformis.AAC.1
MVVATGPLRSLSDENILAHGKNQDAFSHGSAAMSQYFIHIKETAVQKHHVTDKAMVEIMADCKGYTASAC